MNESQQSNRGKNLPKKIVHIYVDADIEFDIDISSEFLTCGWLLSEVTRRYNKHLENLKRENDRN